MDIWFVSVGYRVEQGEQWTDSPEDVCAALALQPELLTAAMAESQDAAKRWQDAYFASLQERKRLMTEAQDIETQPDDLTEMAWGVIANARDWTLEDKQADNWREAARRWRDDYFTSLPDRVA